MQQHFFMKDSFKNGSCLFLSAIAFPLLFGLQAQGRIYVVTNTNDTTKITSLRGAIMDANRNGGNNTIILGQSRRRLTYRLTLSGADEDTARTGDLDITRGNLTITGTGFSVVIDATGLGDRVFQILPRASLTLANLTITGGTAPGNGDSYLESGESGGAIFNAGILSLEHCIITNNSSGGGNFPEGDAPGTAGGDGGGIYNLGAMTMSDCIVAGNSAGTGADGATGGNGGGIKNDGNCHLTGCVLFENQSGAGGERDLFGIAGSGGDGGGVYNTCTLTACKCIISGNSTGLGADGGVPGISVVGEQAFRGGDGGNGAGIYNAGSLRLQFSTINGNTNGNGGNGGEGGSGGNGAGIYNTAELLLDTCTISGNSSGNGGADNDNEVNVAPWDGGGNGGSGGGVCNLGELSINSCTIVANSTGNGGDGDTGWGGSYNSNGGTGGSGGGVFNGSGGTCTNVSNSLITLNSVGDGGLGGLANSDTSSATNGIPGANGSGPDLAGNFTSQGFNLIGMADGSTGLVNGVKADQVGSIASPIDPLIGPLQMNGGPTPTHALLPGSPAVDQGNSFGVHTDQRGYHRPYNYTAIANAPGGDGSDIGAFELDAH